MKRKFSRLLVYMFVLLIGLLLFEIFYPNTYDVPQLQKRTGTQYWHLSTGSDIGYTHLAADSNKKPYPLIYLHGGPGGYIRDYDIHTLSALTKDGYDVYLYDQVGSGQSNRLGDIVKYTVERHISDLKEIIKNTGAEKVILIGQSWGGIFAALFAAENPGLVDKIIFTNPGPMFPVKKELAGIPSPDSFHLRAPFFSNEEGDKEAGNIRETVDEYLATVLGIKMIPDEEADKFATYQAWLVNRSVVCDTARILKQEAGNGYYAQIMTYHSLSKIKDQRSAMRQLQTPVLVMKAQCDNKPWGFTNEYLQLFQNHQLAVIPDAGHFIAVEQPEAYIKAIRQFLSQ